MGFPILPQRWGARCFHVSFVLEGEKFFCVNGPMADLFLVFAYLDGRKGLENGLCCFVVPRGARDVWIGPAVEALGYRGLPVSSLVLKGVVLDKTSLLGDEGSGRLVLRESWQWDALARSSPGSSLRFRV
jgi:alkylation response protein AidB-like acyl-CoA dehydrogenase